VTIANSEEIDISIPYEKQPVYLESKRAFRQKNYQRAIALITELAGKEVFEARANRSLGIAKLTIDLSQAEHHFIKAYEKGDIVSYRMYLSLLADEGRYHELQPYLNHIIHGAIKDPHLFNAFCLLSEHWSRDSTSHIPTFLAIVRHTPLEIMTGNESVVRMLEKYGQMEDAVLTLFTKKELAKLRNDSNITASKKLHYPSDDIINEYQATREWRQFQELRKSWQQSTTTGDDLRAELIPLLTRDDFMILVNNDFGEIAFRENDFIRVEQTLEISLYCDAQVPVMNLFIASLIIQGKREKAKKYENELIKYIHNREGRKDREFIAKYCLWSENRDLFFQWVRSERKSMFLENAGVRKNVIQGLVRWGSAIDSSLRYYLEDNAPLSNKEMNWNPKWGIKINNRYLGLDYDIDSIPRPPLPKSFISGKLKTN
jgi:hypothetical protein